MGSPEANCLNNDMTPAQDGGITFHYYKNKAVNSISLTKTHYDHGFDNVHWMK